MVEAAAEISRKESSFVTPVLRRAVLLQTSPPPDAAMADTLVDRLSAEWAAESSVYKKVVAQASGISLDDLSWGSQEEIRCRLEGKTRVVDFPRLRFEGSADLAFDTRITMAICVEEKEMSSKAWSRLGLPQIRGQRSVVALEDLSALTHRFRRIAVPTSDWALSLLRRTIRRLEPGLKTRRRGCLEVSALGARDEQLAPCFEKLTYSEAKAEQLLKDDPELEKRVSRYFRSATSIPIPRLRDVVAKEPDSFWFSSPVAVELDHGELGSREVLYLLRPTANAVEAVGLAYDDSVAGDLAQKSAVKVSRWMANRS
ncbi:MAG TPA: hypothetical protein VH988_11495 [Thermoanaerobaculia bacterium]|jgi:hypothetical protein|nr:hypothetical protein [Thermoanaerobaculia bacterium]